MIHSDVRPGNICLHTIEVKCTLRWQFKKWSSAVRERDSECVACGGDAEQAHHILPKVLYPLFRFSTDNGASLCDECHRALPREQTAEKPVELAAELAALLEEAA